MERALTPPAMAYFVVSSMLPDWYFVTPPPENPTVVSVAAVRDQKLTEWAMPAWLAEELAAALKLWSGLHFSVRAER